MSDIDDHIKEQEEWLRSQPGYDKLGDVLDFSKIPQQPPIEWSTGTWNGPLIELDPDDPFGDMERLFSRGIHVISITPPEQGWPIAFYCPLCRETTFILSPWTCRPKINGKEYDGYNVMKEMCGNDEHAYEHNLQFAFKRTKFPADFPQSDPMLWWSEERL